MAGDDKNPEENAGVTNVPSDLSSLSLASALPAVPSVSSTRSARSAPSTGPILPTNLYVSELSLEQRFEECMKVAEECISHDDLHLLLQHKEHPIVYDGFEPSGRMHIAQGVLRSINVNRLTSAGCLFRFWVADWFAMMNNKMNGDIKRIQMVGKYFIEIWKAVGMNMQNVQFLWASEEINKSPDTYWSQVIDIARRFNLPRIQRCCTIMGRKEQEEMSGAQIMYPCMQCADIFYLKADICQLGMDQRKVNMLAREYCDQKKIKHKPVILSHHMLMGLKQGQEKMSKSDPESAIFMEDTVADVARKIKKAYCPPEIVEKNPILDYLQHIIFPFFQQKQQEWAILIKRKEANGGDVSFSSYKQLEEAYGKGEIHPSDLKPCLAEYLNEILEPVRKHFSEGEPKKLLAQIKKFKVTK